MIRYHTPSTAMTTKIEATPRCVRTLEERMADDMRELAFAGQNVSAETLIERGWTIGTIKRLAPAAVTIARRLSVRRNA